MKGTITFEVVNGAAIEVLEIHLDLEKKAVRASANGKEIDVTNAQAGFVAPTLGKAFSEILRSLGIAGAKFDG